MKNGIVGCIIAERTSAGAPAAALMRNPYITPPPSIRPLATMTTKIDPFASRRLQSSRRISRSTPAPSAIAQTSPSAAPPMTPAVPSARAVEARATMSDVAATVMKNGYFGRRVIMWPCAIGGSQGVCLFGFARNAPPILTPVIRAGRAHRDVSRLRDGHD
jgi:hypothetical protein